MLLCYTEVQNDLRSVKAMTGSQSFIGTGRVDSMRGVQSINIEIISDFPSYQSARMGVKTLGDRILEKVKHLARQDEFQQYTSSAFGTEGKEELAKPKSSVNEEEESGNEARNLKFSRVNSAGETLPGPNATEELGSCYISNSVGQKSLLYSLNHNRKPKREDFADYHTICRYSWAKIVS